MEKEGEWEKQRKRKADANRLVMYGTGKGERG